MAARGMHVNDANFTEITAHGGTAMPKFNPEAMKDFIGAGIKVLERGEKIPKFMWKQCAGVVLVSAEEAGFLVSAQGGAGVALAHKDGKWSNPIAVNIVSVRFFSCKR